MPLKLNSSGGGSVTVQEPTTAANRTLTLPDSTGSVLTDTTLPAQLNASGSAPLYAARAWVNFNGTGTVSIRASGNVSSITDNGTGDYTVNFTTAMPDTNSSVAGAASLLATGSATPRFVAPVSQAGISTTNVQVRTANDAGVTEDCASVSIAVFR